MTGSDPQTGSDVFSNGKPLSSWKKGSWAEEEAKPRRKRGLKVQSPILGRGGDFYTKSYAGCIPGMNKRSQQSVMQHLLFDNK